MDATRKSLVTVFRRAMDRKAYREHKKFDVTEEDIERELEKQFRRLDHDATRAIDQRFRAGNLPPELQRFMQEILFEEKRKP